MDTTSGVFLSLIVAASMIAMLYLIAWLRDQWRR
jgi:hypothetical protein